MYRKLVAAGLLPLALAACADKGAQSAETIDLTTYKSASCSCCSEWVEHARESGFSVSAKNVSDLNAVKNRHQIAPLNQSCHTSVSAEGYVFEGHVPARLIHRFLENPPAGALGLAVPAMPLGSPGMEVGDRFTPYQVWQLNKDGSRTVYADIATAAAQFGGSNHE